MVYIEIILSIGQCFLYLYQPPTNLNINKNKSTKILIYLYELKTFKSMQLIMYLYKLLMVKLKYIFFKSNLTNINDFKYYKYNLNKSILRFHGQLH